MQKIESFLEMQEISRCWKKSGERVGFVPTMGYLHEGHLSLVDHAKRSNDRVVLSVFVNPTQFGPGEDFAAYPRDLLRDQQLAAGRGVDVFFHPQASEVYAPGDQTSVVVTELSRGLDGPIRPGHFRGVTTVVTKLLLMVLPDQIFMGEKDYQQLKIIERLVQDLKFPVRVVGVETQRDPDGLAMSSRNVYLNAEERQSALRISSALRLAQQQVRQGERNLEKILQQVYEELRGGVGIQVEYAQIVDPENLQELHQLTKPARLLLAVRVQGKRLIDNGPLDF